MHDNDDTTGKVTEIVKAAEAVLGKVPVYDDAVQPLAKQVGKTGEVLGRSINAALIPLRVVVWSLEKIEDWLVPKLEEKLAAVRPEDIETPNPHVAGPLIEALRFTDQDPDLREMFANLLATAMNKQTANDAHPSFVEAIKQMTSDEAKIMLYIVTVGDIPLIELRVLLEKPNMGHIAIAGNVCAVTRSAACSHPWNEPTYVDNLCRLRLLEIPGMLRKAGVEAEYKHLFEWACSWPDMQKERDRLSRIHGGAKFDYGGFGLRLTEYGQLFCEACLPAQAKKADKTPSSEA